MLGGPCLTAVQRDICPSVVGLDVDVRVVGIDPHVVVVSVGYRPATPRLASIFGFPVALAHSPQDVWIFGVGLQVTVIEGASANRCEVRHLVPRVTSVIGAEHTALAPRCLHQDVDTVRVGGGDGKVRLSSDPGGKAVIQVGPVIAAILGLVDAALVAAADDRPGLPLGEPHGGVDLVGAAGDELEIHGARSLRDEKDVLPRVASVGRPVDATFGVRGERIPDSGHVNQVGVPGVDEHGAGVSHILEPNVLPRLAGVSGLVDAFADDDVAPQSIRAGRHIHDIGVGLGHGDGADGAGGEVPIGDVAPDMTVVGGLPHTAPGSPHVECRQLSAVAGDSRDTAAARRSHHSVGEV